MTRYIQKPLLEHAMWRPGEPAPALQKPKPKPQHEPSMIEGTYILMPQVSTYALGVHALQEACKAETHSPHPQFILDDESLIYRPLSFKETIEARVEDYENNKSTEERKRLFKRWNDSCTGIVYKGSTTKFKVVPSCNQLITINKDFREESIAVDYDAIEGIELDRAAGKYTAHLTKDEVLANEGWRAAVENDLELLKTYGDIVFTELSSRNDAMAFCVLDKPVNDQLRALFVYDLNDNSGADGDSYLISDGSFLHVAPVGAREM